MKLSTVLIVYEGKQFDCSFDNSQPLAQILLEVCHELNVQKPPELLALRLFDTDELITDENLRRKTSQFEKLKLVPSPAVEAERLIELLKSEDQKTYKGTLFSLQKYLKEAPLADEFFARGGVKILADVICSVSGNTLAYALTSLQNLMEHDHGWENLSPQFIDKIVSILVNQNLVNICRPATAVLIRLVCADAANPTAGIQTYGFSVVRAALLSSELNFLPTLIQRLSTTDYILQINSLSLLNSLFRHVTEEHREEFVHMLDSLNVRKAILRLMQTGPVAELVKHVVEFQRLLIGYYYRKKQMPITAEESHQAMLEELWTTANIQAEKANKWRKIGFFTEFPKKELRRVGLFGLENMVALVRSNRDWYIRTIADQGNRPSERRCPFARTVIEAIELLGDFWDINTGYTTSTSFQPLLLSFDVVTHVTVQSFFRMWAEMQATSGEFSKVSALVRSQLKFALQSETMMSSYQFEKDMLQVPYTVVRERQLKELEKDGDVLTKLPVRNLREQLYKESVEFVRNQRINCLLNGAWFPLPRPTVKGGRGKDAKSMHRFYRLSPNQKILHHGEFNKDEVDAGARPPLEMLVEKIDLSLVTNVVTGTASPLFATKRDDLDPGLVFSLMSGEHSVADLTAENGVRYAEWTDGLNMLLDKSIACQATAEIIHTLTEIQVQIQLLDIAGEKVEIPNVCEVPELPRELRAH